MALTLDPALEQRIQQVVATGAFREASELLAHALDLVEAEHKADEWLLRNKSTINTMLDESSAQVDRGETYSPEEAHRILAERRAARLARVA